jgi:histidinol-phosphatase (PHP family)
VTLLARTGHGIRRRMVRWTRPGRELGREAYSGLVDYHIHTRLCGHARGEPEQYVREAIRKGFREIGFADHMPMLRIRDEHLTMRPDELPLYVGMIRDLQESVEELTIRLGIEMDYLAGQMDEIWEAAGPYEFDYVYGAVHYIDGWDFGDSRNLSRYRGSDPDSMYQKYFELFCEAVEKGGFDVMAHPDLVKKHGARTNLPIERMYEAAAEALAQADVAIEVNSSGLRKHVGELYPTLDFLSACASRGVAVTLGSDAHSPEQVGMDFDLSLKHLRRAGVTEIASFRGRKRTMLPLPL